MINIVQLLLLICLLPVNVSFASAVHTSQRAATMDIPLLERHTAVPVLTPETAKPRLNLEKIDVREEPPQKEIERRARISFHLALIAMCFPIVFILHLAGAVLGMVMGSLAILCGVFSLIVISRHKEKYRGRGFAIVGIVLGMIAVFLWRAVMQALLYHR